MKKALFILLLTIFCHYGYAVAEICDYTLNRDEVTDDTGKVKAVPMFDLDKKPMTIKLRVAGLGTSHITAQCPILSLSIETQIYPMDKPDNGTGDDGAQWYYVRYSGGVTIIELKGDNVKVHTLGNLGFPSYTYTGTRNSSVSSLVNKTLKENESNNLRRSIK